MLHDKSEQDQIDIHEYSDLLEMEMEEYDSFQDKYTEVSGKIEGLLKNLVLTKISNKRNELNILYLFQKVNGAHIKSEKFEELFKNLDDISNDINNNKYSYDELITKSNDLGRKINPMIRELLI
jgi:hypothetical protein